MKSVLLPQSSTRGYAGECSPTIIHIIQGLSIYIKKILKESVPCQDVLNYAGHSAHSDLGTFGGVSAKYSIN